MSPATRLHHGFSWMIMGYYSPARLADDLLPRKGLDPPSTQKVPELLTRSKHACSRIARVSAYSAFYIANVEF